MQNKIITGPIKNISLEGKCQLILKASSKLLEEAISGLDWHLMQLYFLMMATEQTHSAGLSLLTWHFSDPPGSVSAALIRQSCTQTVVCSRAHPSQKTINASEIVLLQSECSLDKPALESRDT